MHNSNYKLLVVDDEMSLRQSLVTYLEDSGFVVYDAPDATHGLELFRETLPDLVITDLRMPNIDGLTLLKQIHDISPNIPVIVISGASVMGDVVEALRLGATDYLIKPVVDMEVLIHAIHKSLERNQLLIENHTYRVELEQANEQLKRHIRALEQDQKAGNFVQQSMLPVSPFYAKDLVCEHKVIPSLYLSGDCIDYAFLRQRYYAFYLADISGHGSAPAFVSIWLKNLVAQLVRLRQLMVQFNSQQEVLLELVNIVNAELLDMGLNNHLTFIIGIIDTKTNTLAYCIAGHLPMPVLISQGKAEYLPGKGKPIGLYQNTHWDVHQYQLPEKPCNLCVFSDGILEVLPEKDLIAKEQALLQLVEQTNGDINTIIDQLNLNQRADIPDDIALLSIKANY